MRLVTGGLAMLFLTGMLSIGCHKPPAPKPPAPATNSEAPQPVDPIDPDKTFKAK